MNFIKKRWKLLLVILFCLVIVGITIFLVGRSFGFFQYAKEGEITNVITMKGIKIEIINPEDDALNLENAYPVSDSEGLSYTPFVFSMTNTTKRSLSYSILVQNDEKKQADCILEDNTICPELSTRYIKYSYKRNDGSYTESMTLSSTNDIVASGTIYSGETITSSIILWISSEAGNEIMNHYFYGKVLITGEVSPNYSEALLNGADPVLSDNLVPVQIANDGTVTKANINEEWYKYENKNWANAVVLKDTSITYEVNETIPESNIESYFVWIPKYSYQLWDLGNYSSVTSVDSTKPHPIPIKFGLTNTDDAVTGECTTPGLSGESGNCEVGEYMTHPAFLAFNSNGFWVGKFETGYDGATSTTAAQIDSNDSGKIIIKPNVYSWRRLTVGNSFKVSYDYLRADESHMMKNTEWGAVAYLHHSIYGSTTSLRINNNSNLITGYAGVEEPTKGYNSGTSVAGNRVEGTTLGKDGTYTLNYLNANSVVASTTGNITGIYDMSGGATEYVAGYTTGTSTVGGSSGITGIYSDFFTNSNWNKYYDRYSSTAVSNYNKRILGDATGEIGPFRSQSDPDNNARNKSSWYGDYANFTNSSNPWFDRGGLWNDGSSSGVFAFDDHTGAVSNGISFRIVLTPTK